MYTLEMTNNMETLPAIYESPARNLVELQKELDTWGVCPRIINAFKNDRLIVTIFDGVMQLNDNTIIN